MIDYDAELRHHQRAFRRALDVHRGDRVLDIGCGAGGTTRDVARIATDGQTIGIDIARPGLQRARQLTLGDGPRNVEYVCCDAARLPFPPASFDIAISRFGTMFFADPVPAFTNICRVLRPKGRLVMMVWQAAAQNAWAVAIHRALVGDDTALPEAERGPSAFSLGDSGTVQRILHDAMFVDITLEPVHEAVYYGPDAESALGFVMRFSNVTAAMEAQPAPERERTRERLRATMVAHQMHDGVLFDSEAWIVTARCG